MEVVNVKSLHGVDHRLDARYDVLIHHTSEAFPVSVIVSFAMDDPHLFDESTLPTFTSPWANKMNETEGWKME